MFFTASKKEGTGEREANCREEGEVANSDEASEGTSI